VAQLERRRRARMAVMIGITLLIAGFNVGILEVVRDI